MVNQKVIKALALFILSLSHVLFAQEIKFADSRIVFASVDQGKAALTNRDEFIAALSPFDRSARMKTTEESSEKSFLTFVSTNVLSWSEVEKRTLTKAVAAIDGKLLPFRLPLPPEILLIKSSGNEEGNASYTRQNAIILPQHDAESNQANLEKLLTHELFHILSRHDSETRKKLYNILGFSQINEVRMNDDFQVRKITNPDGPANGWSITVTNEHQTLQVVPILLSSVAKYDLKKGGEFFNYLGFHLMSVKQKNDQWVQDFHGGKPILLDPNEVQGYFEQIGRNTDYIIHPDEIMADNFVKMVWGDTNLATPRIVTAMKKVLLN
ncbi:MAG: hypothetical protein JWM99_1282 [Verrucomicrobiales bacterium]|nr:hypothetical protein [Verrucomicrobiales bacterium]